MVLPWTVYRLPGRRIYRLLPASRMPQKMEQGAESLIEQYHHQDALGSGSRIRDDQAALQRAEILLKAHVRFRKLLGGGRYKVVEPVLPMDLMGVYVLLPEKKATG